MKLATLRDGSRDGRLLVVSRDGTRQVPAEGIARTLQSALDDWEKVAPELEALSQKLNAGEVKGDPVDVTRLAAPLPRAYEWVDGSAYLNHVRLVRKARGAEPPATLETDPLVYQGGTSGLLGPTDDIPLADPAWGCDFESELAVVLDDTPQGTRSEDAGRYVRLLMSVNDVSLRNLIPPELAKGFGFFQSKPASAFGPFAVTPDELGEAWKDGRVHLRVKTWLNGEVVGDTDAGPEMHFSFFDLIQHLTRTRGFTAGVIVGSGTVSNEERARGISCLAERRMIEIIEQGGPKTPFLQHGDTVKIDVPGPDGVSVFGTIEQKVVPA